MMSRGRVVLSSIVLPLFAVGIMLLILILYLPSQAASATYTVNSTADTDDGTCNAGNCTLREAILAANDTQDADTIVFSLPPSSTIILNGTQLPIITETLTIDGSTAENLTISGNNTSRLFVIGQLPPSYPGPTTYQPQNVIGNTTAVTLTSLTLTDGLENFGGAISNSGILTILDSTITEMSAYRGGVYSENTLIISNTTFYDNSITTGSSAGAGIYNTGQGSVIIRGSAFINNSVNSTSAIGGGAIYNDSGTLTVTDSIFIGNSYSGSSFGGGAIGQKNGITNSLYISNSTFISNTSSFGGGAIRFAQSQPIIIANSTFIGNQGPNGGAILGVSTNGFVIKGSYFTLNSASNGGAIRTNYPITITNSTFNQNWANNDGGALSIYIFEASPTYISNTTFISNTALDSGGAIDYVSDSGPLWLQNSTLMGNGADEGGAIYLGGDVDIANSTLTENSADLGGAIFVSIFDGNLSLINSTLSDNFAGIAGAGLNNFDTVHIRNSIIANSAGGADCVNNGTISTNLNNLIEDGTCNPLLMGDPILGPLQHNGGNTWTHALLFGSPAIDAGDPTNCANPPVNNLDQRGETRPTDGDGDGIAICDIGAYEADFTDFSLVKSGPMVAAAGEFITYTLSVTNNQLVTVTDVLLTDTIPVNANYVSGGTLVGNVVSWTVPELSVGAAFSRSFIVTATQTITNDDYRVSANGDYSTSGNTAVVTIVADPITGLAASNDSPTTIGSPTNLMATITSGSDVSFAWNFGDGNTGSGANVSHTYSSVGQYTAVVTASNSVGEAVATTNVTIENDDWAIYMPVVLNGSGNSQQGSVPAPIVDKNIMTPQINKVAVKPRRQVMPIG